MRKNPHVDQANAARAEPAGRDAQPARRPECSQPSPKRMEHQADNVCRLGVKPSIENDMGRIEDPHLALRQARKAVTPQVVPDRQPSRAQRIAQKPHQADEKLGDIATDQHLAANADRPEPGQQCRHHGQNRQNARGPGLKTRRASRPRRSDLAPLSVSGPRDFHFSACTQTWLHVEFRTTPAESTQGNSYKAAIDFTRRTGRSSDSGEPSRSLQPARSVLIHGNYPGRVLFSRSLAREVLYRTPHRENKVDP